MDWLDNLSMPEQVLCLKATKQKIPVNGVLELTPLCNMQCEMCYVRLSHDAMCQQGRMRTVDEWIELAKEMLQAGTIFLLLTGGEPLLYPDFKKLYLALRKMGMILTINTNGTLIDEGWADFFAQYKPRRINVTLYGSNEEVYESICHQRAAFHQVLKAIHLLKQRQVDVKINGTLTKNNRADAMAIYELASELETYCKIDTYLYPVGNEQAINQIKHVRLLPEEAARWQVKMMEKKLSAEALHMYVEQMADKISQPIDSSNRQMICRAGRSSFFINWKGIMTSCLFLDKPCCNVFESGFLESWHYIAKETELIRLSSVCASCQYQSVCQTCAACAVTECGSFDGTPEYMCRYTKEIIRNLNEMI